MVIDGQIFVVACQVMPDALMISDMMLGKNLLRCASMSVVDGRVDIVKRSEGVCDSMNPFASMDVQALVTDAAENTTVRDYSDIENPIVRQQVMLLESHYKPRKIEHSCVKLKLVLTDDVPVFRPPRRLAPREATDVSNVIDAWLEEGIIRHSNSNYASPIVVARKKDGSARLCVDFRALNEKVVRDRYPLPVIEDVLEKFYDAKVYSTLDLRNGFFYVDMDSESVKYTAFVTPNGHYEFLKAPFGLCNSPAVFQRFINTVFWPLMREGVVMVYMDDLIVPAANEIENIERVQRVLEVAQNNGLAIRFDKCEFVRRRVSFLGHILENNSVRPSDEKTRAISAYPEPKTVKHVQSFLGLAGFFRKFEPKFALIAKPLTDLTRKDVRFVFDTPQRQAFETLKAMLCNDPVLKLFNPNSETELHTDASAVGYGACLMQKHADAFFHPVFYLSAQTSDAESRYSSYELEVLAIVNALSRLRVYLLGLKFVIYTDCQAFQMTMKKKDLVTRVARWALFLEEFDCSVKHRAGSAMRHVDALSRFPVVMVLEDCVLRKVKACQSDDEDCKLVIDVLADKGVYKDYVLRRDALYRFRDGNFLLVVPKTMQAQIVRGVHERGHMGVHKVCDVVRQDYAIDKLEEKVAKLIANCVPCILSSRKAGKQEGLYNPIDKSDLPLHTFHVDHLGPMPSTAKSYQHLFVIVDAFTKFVWLYPVKSTTTAEALKRLATQSEVFGNPVRIISDRGTAFTSGDFRAYCEREDIQHVTTTTGVQRGNGQVERINGMLIPMLTKMAIDNPMQWYRHVAVLQRFINATVSRSTGRTPFELLVGVKMRCTDENRMLVEALEHEIVQSFEGDRLEARAEAKLNIEKVQEENRRTYDRKRKVVHQYVVKDWMAIKKTQFSVGAKVQPSYLGPYEVVRVMRNDRYVLQKVGDGPGPISMTSAADFMKSWAEYTESSEAYE